MIRIETKIIITILLLLIAHTSAAQDEDSLNDRISKNSKDYVAITKLGILYQDQGHREEALRLFKKAVEIAPDYPDAHFFAGRLYFLTRKYSDAVEELSTYKKIMQTIPSMDEKTKKLYIDDLYYLSEVYFALKRYAEGRKELEGILKIDPNESDAYYNLGFYYYIYEHSRPRAYYNFKMAADMDPSSESGKNANYAIEFIRANPDSRFEPDFSFIDRD